MSNDALEIDQDLEHEQRAWKVRRITWALMALTIALALTGLLGGTGPLVRATAGEQGGLLWLSYDRYVRSSAQATLELYVQPIAGSDTTSVWIDRDYLEHVHISQTVPDASDQQIRSDGIVYSFDTAGANAPVTIVFQTQPQRAGVLSGQMGIVDGPALAFEQFAYP